MYWEKLSVKGNTTLDTTDNVMLGDKADNYDTLLLYCNKL